jgi:DNA-binding MarR family transcriptional regulator
MQALVEAPSGSDQALVRDLGLLMRHLLERSNREVFAAFEELDLSFTQTKMVMAFTGRDQPRSIKSIADEHGISLPATSRAIDGLLKRGLVTRTEDPDDRRSKQIALTEAGREVTERMMELRVAGIADFVATLHPDERKQLAAVLDPIVDRDQIGVTPPTSPAPRSSGKDSTDA